MSCKVFDRIAAITATSAIGDAVAALAMKHDLPITHLSIDVPPQHLSAPMYLGKHTTETAARLTISPVCLSSLHHVLKERNIVVVVFIGGFPFSHFLRDGVDRAISTIIAEGADSEFLIRYREFRRTSSSALSYALSVQAYLTDNGYYLPLAGRIFPELLAEKSGYLTTSEPSIRATNSLPALVAALTMTARASGQNRFRISPCAIVDRGTLVMIETVGTNQLLRRYSTYSGRRESPILLKAPALDLMTTVDQPTIGPDTIERSVAAGVRGIVFCRETTVLIERDLLIRTAERRGVFLYAFPLATIKHSFEPGIFDVLDAGVA